MLSLFQIGDFAEYQIWFADPLLQRRLGPLDEDWLAYVLQDQTGAQYVYREAGEMVAVIGLAWADREHPYHVLTDLAVHPQRRRQGIARRAVAALFEHLADHPVQAWRAYVERDNRAAQAFFRSMDWQYTEAKEGMVVFSVTHNNPD